MGSSGRSRRSWADRIRPLRRLAGPIEAAQVRRFGTSALSVVFRTRVLVLETVGRRSGTTRSTTVAYHRADDSSWLIVGGAGGQSSTADWVANLRAHPEAIAVIDRARVSVTAVELTGADRADVWHELRRVWPRLDVYERRAGRHVPVIRLLPR